MGPYLKSLREKRGITQEKIAQVLGLSRPTYLLIEKGNRELTISEMKKLASFYGLSLTDFLSEKDETPIIVHIQEPEPVYNGKEESSHLTGMRISVPRENLAVFKEVLLYILEKIGALPNVGESLICKILYFIDFDYYEKFEEQFIGAVYIKNHHGPTPAAFKTLIQEMTDHKELIPVKTKYFQYQQKKYLPLRRPDLSLMTARAKELIDSTMERFKDFNAAKMEEYSHNDVPWITAEHLRPLDYEAVFYRTPEYSQRNYDA